mgnify:CR=1 FL=1
MAKVNIKSEKITPFGGIYYASKAFYGLYGFLCAFFEAFESQSPMGKGELCPNLNVFGFLSCRYTYAHDKNLKKAERLCE